MSPFLHLFGQPYAQIGARRVEPTPTKPAYLLYYLAYQRDWVGREELAAVFRPQADDPTARNHLRLLLTRARRLEWATGLEVEAHRVRWPVESDVGQFRSYLAQGRWEQVLGVYGGSLLALPSLRLAGFEDWLEGEREVLHEAWKEAASQQAAQLLPDQPQVAARLLGRVLEADALAEPVLQLYLKSSYLAGAREEALGRFESFRKRLSQELGLKPLAGTLEIVELIRQAQPLSLAGGPAKPSVPLQVLRPPHLIGREDAMQSLRQAPARVVLVRGEAGLGKSRLLGEAYPKGVWIQSQEGLEQVPYFPLIRALRERMERLGQLPELGAYREDLARLVPEVWPGHSPMPLEGESLKPRLLEALAQAFSHSSVLIFDDLQWADPATLEWLVFMAQRSTPTLVGAYRSNEVSPALDKTLSALQSGQQLGQVTLKTLDSSALEALLADLMRPAPVAVDFAAWLYQKSGGNPFFALETLRALIEAGTLQVEGRRWQSRLDELSRSYSELEVPVSVQQVIQRRVERLPEGTRQVLEAASVVRSGFSPQLLSAVLGVSEWDVSEPWPRPNRGSWCGPHSSATTCWPSPSTPRSALQNGLFCTARWPRPWKPRPMPWWWPNTGWPQVNRSGPKPSGSRRPNTSTTGWASTAKPAPCTSASWGSTWVPATATKPALTWPTTTAPTDATPKPSNC